MLEIRSPGVYLDRSGNRCYIHFLSSDGDGFDEAHGLSGTTGRHGMWCPYSGLWFRQEREGCADIIERVGDLGPNDHGFQRWSAPTTPEGRG